MLYNVIRDVQNNNSESVDLSVVLELPLSGKVTHFSVDYYDNHIIVVYK